jgi:ketosteroid isomerase-like protein
MSPFPQVNHALVRIGKLIAERDMQVLSEFTEDAIVVGFEPGEIAIGRDQNKTLFEDAFAGTAQLSFDWETVRAQASGNVACFFADGRLVMTVGAEKTSTPYRLSGVIEQIDGRWRWRQFHGSEPIVR